MRGNYSLKTLIALFLSFLGTITSHEENAVRGTHKTITSHEANVDESNVPFDKILVAYQSWSECDNATITAVENGVNVVIWFATNLDSDEEGNAVLTGGPNHTCVEGKIAQLAGMGYGRDKVKHLISVGGWDAPHPDTSNTAEEYAEAFEVFSGGLFDGLDWDLEGNDSLTAKWNYFSKECLELMADLSKILHDRGYIISMAPPESYLDIQTTAFSKYVNLTYPDDDWGDDPPFSYHGHNVYSYPLAKEPDAFDFVSIQIYETKSHASYNTTVLGVPQVDYMTSYIKSLVEEGVTVDFTTDEDFKELGVQKIKMNKIIVGLISAGGVGGPITAANASKVFAELEEGSNIDGFFFWCIGDDKDGSLPKVLGEGIWG
ncbi:hypothetical protein TrCOL_g4590 [Triparma columacea]|uniref:Chitinase n=1 Tax=Triparma columacea TaxID=722753 RepID=A0A9W7GE27_9STRA|nr:hypothetical protein TrCOL_g4590 [Triparma columacea]